jgi:hypothetical protein
VSDSKKVELKVEASVTENRLMFRMPGATAELEDGRKLEVAWPVCANGIMVTITNVDGTWRSYFLGMHALGSAVLAEEQKLVDQEQLDELNAAMGLYTPQPGECICWKCLNGKNYAGMVLCPTCGNKRCPKASDHELECTNSNEPGQPGSMYGTIAPDEQPPET